MKTKICTDVKQSKKLLELGVDVNTADMYYMYRHWEIDENTVGAQSDAHIGFNSNFYHGADNGKTFHYIPAWSLSALLELMPQTIDKDDKWLLRLQRCYHRHVSRFICTYPYTKSTSFCDSPLDAAFEMVVWLKENGKI